MQRIMVDFPDPDGPQTTTFSPCPTVEIDVVQHLHRAEPLVDVAELDAGIRCCRSAAHRSLGLPHVVVRVPDRRHAMSAPARPAEL